MECEGMPRTSRMLEEDRIQVLQPRHSLFGPIEPHELVLDRADAPFRLLADRSRQVGHDLPF